MKTFQSRFAAGTLMVLTAMPLAACTYYHTTEQPAAQAPSTVIVPRAPAPSAVVLPKSTSPDTETVIVAPDSTVTVTPWPNDQG